MPQSNIRHYAADERDLLSETDDWLRDLFDHGRKENTLRCYRNNVFQCLQCLRSDGRGTRASEITPEDVTYLWRNLPVKEGVKRSYLRSLAGMVSHHTGVDIVKQANILYNREVRDRTFITKQEFRIAYEGANEMQRLIICLGAYMGLRRAEMCGIRDGDIRGDELTIHGKGHGEGLTARVRIPAPVQQAIADYRASPFKKGKRRDDYLLQMRDHRMVLHVANVSKVSDQITRLGKEVGVHITTHSLRRFYATTLYYDAQCDLQTIRRLMRHADVSTTLKCYVDANDQKEREASERITGIISDLVDS